MMANMDIGIYGLSSGSIALAKRLDETGRSVAMCDLPQDRGSGRKRLSPLEGREKVENYPDLTSLRSGLGQNARIFVFSHYDDYEKSAAGIAATLRPGDIVHECNAFPFGSIQAIQALYTEAGIAWMPIKIAMSRDESGSALSLVASAVGLDDVSRSLLEGIAKKRLDGRACYAELPDPRLVAASRAAYRGLLDTLLQGFADAYFIMGALLKMSPSEARMAFSDWGRTELDSPVLNAVRDILASMDESGESALSRILDTVKFDSSDLDSLALSVAFKIPQPLSFAALSARLMASMRDERVGASVSLSGAKSISPRPREFPQ